MITQLLNFNLDKTFIFILNIFFLKFKSLNFLFQLHSFSNFTQTYFAILKKQFLIFNFKKMNILDTRYNTYIIFDIFRKYICALYKYYIHLLL